MDMLEMYNEEMCIECNGCGVMVDELCEECNYCVDCCKCYDQSYCLVSYLKTQAKIE